MRELEARRGLWQAVVLSSVVALVGCGQPEPEPKEPAEPPGSGESIPGAPLSGKVAGKPFSVKSGRYYVDRRPGFEKVDIRLYAASSKTRCGELDPEKPPSVWLRRRGPAAVAPGEQRISLDGKSEWEVHYQVQEDEHWVGNGDARALLVIDDIRSDAKIDGALSACFRDAEGSCVSGRFSANYCRIVIDEPIRGSKIMERPPEKKPDPKPAPDAGTADAAPADAAPTSAEAQP